MSSNRKKGRTNTQRMLSDAKRHYFAMLTVLLIVLYILTRSFGVLNYGRSVFIQRFHKNDIFKLCPTPSRLDTPVDLAPYVGIGKDLEEKFDRYKTGGNLYLNSDLSRISENGYPADFEHADKVSYAELSQEADQDSTRYLRSKVFRSPEMLPGKTWLPKFTTVTRGSSYYYSFKYRSNVHTDVTIQYRLASGDFYYDPSNELAPNQDWAKVEGRFRSLDPSYVSARLLVSPKAAGQLDITAMSVYKLSDHTLDSGIVSVAFDDGRKSIFTRARAILQKHEIITTQYVVPYYSKNDPAEYMSFAEIRELQQDGNEIESHSFSHCDQTQLTIDRLNKDETQATELFNKAGIPKPKGFAYPYGAYSVAAEKALRERFGYIRTSNNDYNDFYGDKTLVSVKPVIAETTTEEVKSWLEYAKANRLWVVLLYHQIDNGGEYSTSEKDFNAQMAAVKNSGLHIMTVEKAIDTLK